VKRPLPTVVSIACAVAFAGCGFRTPLDLPLVRRHAYWSTGDCAIQGAPLPLR
jgi:hypothetical protein